MYRDVKMETVKMCTNTIKRKFMCKYIVNGNFMCKYIMKRKFYIDTCSNVVITLHTSGKLVLEVLKFERYTK